MAYDYVLRWKFTWVWTELGMGWINNFRGEGVSSYLEENSIYILFFLFFIRPGGPGTFEPFPNWSVPATHKIKI